MSKGVCHSYIVYFIKTPLAVSLNKYGDRELFIALQYISAGIVVEACAVALSC